MNHETKTPFLRLAKRDGMEGWKVWCIRAGAIVVALLLGAVVMGAVGANPVAAYGTILSGALGKKTAIRQTVKIAVPLLGCALAIAPCFKMRFWNIGAEGQITAGAIAASYFALFWADRLPSPALLVVMGLAGAAAGGIWALIPAFFKAKWNTNETLFTLMMNYVAIQLTSYAVSKWETPAGSNSVGIINQNSQAGWFPSIFGQAYTLNVIIVLILAAAMYIYLKYSKHGYEIAVVGDSVNTARYAGISVQKVYIRTMFLSGAICGIAGFLAVSGSSHTISTDTAGGRGFTAIIVAWLSKFNSFVMILFSFLLVFLQQGAVEIASRYGLNEYVSNIITGILLFFILGSEFFINYQVGFRRRQH